MLVWLMLAGCMVLRVWVGDEMLVCGRTTPFWARFSCEGSMVRPFLIYHIELITQLFLFALVHAPRPSYKYMCNPMFPFFLVTFSSICWLPRSSFHLFSFLPTYLPTYLPSPLVPTYTSITYPLSTLKSTQTDIQHIHLKCLFATAPTHIYDHTIHTYIKS